MGCTKASSIGVKIMPVVSMPDILGPALEKRYGVGAFTL